MRRVHGTKFTGLVALAAAVGAMALPAMTMSSASAAPTPAEDKHHVITTVKEAHVAVDGWDTESFTVDCPEDYYAIDGSVLIDSVDTGGDLAEVYTTTSKPTPGLAGWQATVRNDNIGRVQGKLRVTCLAETTSELDGHAHRIAEPTPAELTDITTTWTNLDDDPVIPPAVCETGVPVAAGYAFSSGYGAVRKAAATSSQFEWIIDPYGPAQVHLNAYCLDPVLPSTVGGHAATSLVFSTLSGSISVGPNALEEQTVSCESGSADMVGSYVSDVGLLSLGTYPKGDARVFRFADVTGDGGVADLDLLCMELKTGAAPTTPTCELPLGTSSHLPLVNVRPNGRTVVFIIKCSAPAKVKATLKGKTAVSGTPIVSGKPLAYGQGTIGTEWTKMRLSVKRGMVDHVKSAGFTRGLLAITVDGSPQTFDPVKVQHPTS